MAFSRTTLDGFRSKQLNYLGDDNLICRRFRLHRVGALSNFVRMHFCYVLLKDFVKLCAELFRRGIRFIVVDPGKQSIAASRADSRYLSFAIGTSLANIAHKKLATHRL